MQCENSRVHGLQNHKEHGSHSIILPFLKHDMQTCSAHSHSNSESNIPNSHRLNTVRLFALYEYQYIFDTKKLYIPNIVVHNRKRHRNCGHAIDT